MQKTLLFRSVRELSGNVGKYVHDTWRQAQQQRQFQPWRLDMLIPNFALASSPHRASAVRFAAPLLCAISITWPCAGVVAQPAGLEKIHHVIVIYQENWSFDGLYGRFPGADGIANAGERVRQMKKDGTPYTTLPQPLDTSKNPPVQTAGFRTNCRSFLIMRPNMFRLIRRQGTSSTGLFKSSFRSTAAEWMGS